VGQRGQTLIEAVVAVAIVTVVLGAALSAALAANAHFGPDPARAALGATLDREMRTARDLIKYQGATLQPASVQTTLPLPAGSPLPATLQLQTSPLPDGGTQLTLSGTATWQGASESASLATTLPAPAPIPGSSLTLTGLAPAPTGAP
jgi:hypothetical protein